MPICLLLYLMNNTSFEALGLQETLHETFSHAHLRPGQEQVINAVMATGMIRSFSPYRITT